MRAAIIAAIVALATLTSTGCGGGGNGGVGGTAAKRAIEPAAQARAEAIVLKQSDLPLGWQASPPEDEDGGEQFRKCLGTDLSDLTLNGDAESDEFAMGENTAVQSQAAVWASTAEAETALEEISDGWRSDAAEACVRKLMNTGLERQNAEEVDVELGDIDVRELSFTRPPSADEAEGWHVAIPMKAASGSTKLSLTVYMDFIDLRDGDALAHVSTIDLAPFDSQLRDDLLEAVASRMSD